MIYIRAPDKSIRLSHTAYNSDPSKTMIRRILRAYKCIIQQGLA